MICEAFREIASGGRLALRSSIMAVRKGLDRQPGVPPEVHRDGDSMTFLLEVAGAPEQVKLVLRCTQTEIFAAVAHVPEPPGR